MAKKTQIKLWHVIAVGAVFLFLFGIIEIPNIQFGTVGTGLVDVSKQLKFGVTDKFAGSALASKSNAVKVYDEDGTTLLETLSTDANGLAATAFTYPSGKSLYVYWNDGSSALQWFHVTVPQMNEQDAESATYNNIPIQTFTITTYTDTLRIANGTSVSDSGVYNSTESSNSVETWTYTVYVATDNKGFMNSYDPIYDMNYYPVMYIKLSGTNYEEVLPYGWDSDYGIGTATWAAHICPDQAKYSVTKWKIGKSYKYMGQYDFTFTIDTDAYDDTTGRDTVTMQLYMYFYSDPAYHQAKGGAFGPNSLQRAEQTVTLKT